MTTTTGTKPVAPKTIPDLPADLEAGLRRLKLAAVRRTATADKRQSSNLPAGPAVSVNNCWVVGCAWLARPMMPGILARCSMPMNAQSWNVCADRMPNCVWTVSFEKCRGLLRLRTEPVEAYRVIEAEKAICRVSRSGFTNGAGPVRPALRRRGSGVPNWTPRSPTSTRPPAALTAPHASWPICVPPASGYRASHQVLRYRSVQIKQRGGQRELLRAEPGQALAAQRRRDGAEVRAMEIKLIREPARTIRGRL
jgi:hypothetical protein